MDETAAELAKTLSATNWQWTTAWWIARSKELFLTTSLSIGTRTTYTDEGGQLWDVYTRAEGILFIEINFDVFEDVGLLSNSAYEDKVDEYVHRFEETVRALVPILGVPAFADGAAARGFPPDQDANWLAMWFVRNARLMLQQKHESKDMPFRLCFVVAPNIAQ